MADGDVSLDREGRQEESRGVHGQELTVDHQRASEPAPDPSVTEDVVGQNLLNTRESGRIKLPGDNIS